MLLDGFGVHGGGSLVVGMALDAGVVFLLVRSEHGLPESGQSIGQDRAQLLTGKSPPKGVSSSANEPPALRLKKDVDLAR